MSRLLRFSLASLAIFITVLAMGLGYWSNRAHQQRAAVKLLRASGAKLWYTDQAITKYDDQLRSYYYVPTESPADSLADYPWLRDYLYDVLVVDAEYVQAFSDYEMNALADLPNLRFVDASNTNVTSRGVTNLRYCRKMLSVDLSETVVDDSCLGYLAELPQLQIVRLINTKITDDGLVKLWLATNLRILDVNAPLVSEAGAEQLQRRLPKCDVIFVARKTVPPNTKPLSPGGGFAWKDVIGTGIEPVADRTLTADELNHFFEQARILIRKPAVQDFLLDESGEPRGPGDLERQLRDFNWHRNQAADELQVIDHRCAIPVLAAVLRDESDDPKVRASAAEALARIPDPLVVEILIEAIPAGDAVGLAAENGLMNLTTVAVGRTREEGANELSPEMRLKRQAQRLCLVSRG